MPLEMINSMKKADNGLEASYRDYSRNPGSDKSWTMTEEWKMRKVWLQKTQNNTVIRIESKVNPRISRLRIYENKNTTGMLVVSLRYAKFIQ